MSGRRNTKSTTAAGTVSRAMMRTPERRRGAERRRSRRPTARAISGTNVVAIDIASSPWGSTKNVKAWKYAAEPPDPGDDRLRTRTITAWLHGDIAERPQRHRQQPPDRRMLGAGTPAGSAARRRAAPGRARAPSRRCPAVEPAASVQRSRSSISTSASCQVPVGEREQGDDDDDVGEHRAPCRGEEAPAGVERGVGQPGGAVEEDLQQEDPREQRADALEQLRVDAFLRLHRVHAEDQRGGEDGE